MLGSGGGKRGTKSLVMPAGLGGEGSRRCPAKSAALPDTRSQPAHRSAPSPVHRRYCSPPAGPGPLPRQDPVPSPGRTLSALPAGPLITRPCPYPPLPNPPSVSLICQSVCPSICLSVPLPSSPHPRGPSQPSLSHPSLPRQPFPARQSPPVCLYVPQPIHPSVCHLIHHATATCPNLPPFACFLVGPPEVPQPALGRRVSVCVCVCVCV